MTHFDIIFRRGQEEYLARLINMVIAGEALTGVIIAVLIVIGINLAVFDSAPYLPGFLIWVYIALLLFYIPIKEIVNKKNID